MESIRRGRVSAELMYHDSNVIHFEPNLNLMPNEEFREISDSFVPGILDIYMVSNYGRIWHKFNRVFLKYNIDSYGNPYKYFRMKNGGSKIIRIHILVKHIFDYYPGCEQDEIIHIDGNNANICIWNLAYRSQIQNYCNQTRFVYTDELIHEICRRLERRDCTIAYLAQELGVPVSLVEGVNKGSIRPDISSQYTIEVRKIPKTFTDDEIEQICKFLESNKQEYKLKIERCKAAIASIGKDPENTRYIKATKKILGKETFLNISDKYDI